MYVCMYVYVYREREKERERGGGRGGAETCIQGERVPLAILFEPCEAAPFHALLRHSACHTTIPLRCEEREKERGREREKGRGRGGRWGG